MPQEEPLGLQGLRGTEEGAPEYTRDKKPQPDSRGVFGNFRDTKRGKRGRRDAGRGKRRRIKERRRKGEKTEGNRRAFHLLMTRDGTLGNTKEAEESGTLS